LTSDCLRCFITTATAATIATTATAAKSTAATKAAAESATTAKATVIAEAATVFTVVTLAQHGRLAFLVFLNGDGHKANDIFVDEHKAFHFSHGCVGGVYVHEGVVGFAVLLDAE
jgi:hypothetical protein